MANPNNVATPLAEATAKASIEGWLTASFETLLDSFHGEAKPGKYGRLQSKRFHTFVLGNEAALALLDPNNDCAKLRVYPSLDPKTKKFSLIVQGRKMGDNTEIYYTGCYLAQSIDKQLEENNSNLPVHSQATTIPFSLARLYIDGWNSCATNDIVDSFHAPITDPVTKATETERASFYTYSPQDVQDLKDILSKNSSLEISYLFFFMGAGDPNPDYGHPFAYRPILRVVFSPKDTSSKSDGDEVKPMIGTALNIPPQVKFETTGDGSGGVVTLDFSTPCPPVCNTI